MLSFALLASECIQNAEDVINTMLLKCKQEAQAAFDRHTPHLHFHRKLKQFFFFSGGGGVNFLMQLQFLAPVEFCF